MCCQAVLRISTPGRSQRSSSRNSWQAITRRRHRLASRRLLPWARSAGHVGAGVGIGAQAHQQDGVQGAVELAVAGAVDSLGKRGCQVGWWSG
jgi:hypothetical protein